MSQVAFHFYRSNWRARTHSSKSGYFHYTQQDISNLTICPFHRSELGLVENAAENMKERNSLQTSGCYKSKKVSIFMLFIPFYYIDTSVLLENIPLVIFIKITSTTRVVYFP